MQHKFTTICFLTILAFLSVNISACKKEKVHDPFENHLNSSLNYGEVKDVDGNSYATIKIGDQTWMAENLRTSRYANGDSIPNIKKHLEWSYLASGAWVHYNNDSTLDQLHGKLYNWYAVNDPRKICPDGWTVPTDENWTALENFLGGADAAGPKLKSTKLSSWMSMENVFSTNESGFSAIASGKRTAASEFVLMTYRGSFWSSTENNNGVYYRELFWNGNTVGRYYDYKTDGLSCRCIKL